MIHRGVASLVLSGLLLLVQAQGLLHELDLDAHADGEACELCLSLAVLDHGFASAPLLLAVPFHAAPPPIHGAEPLLPASDAPYRSRAPPARLLS